MTFASKAVAMRSTMAALLFSVLLLTPGCGIVNAISDHFAGAVGISETGTVISRRANIRSSYAVVAADVLELRRGQMLDIMDEVEFEKVLWYRVRAMDENNTEGWIEAQHIIKEDALDKSRKLAGEEQDKLAQATGQLRAISNLRLTPEQNDDNILLKLDSGSTFEIVGWVYVPKEKTDEDIEQDKENAAARTIEEPQRLNEKYDMWYKIRLDPSVSPAPMGWVFGRQVALQVPSDIVYYQSNDRKFVTWQTLDESVTRRPRDDEDGNNLPEITKPGSWVILSRTNEVRAIKGVEPEFDGILILGFDKYNEEHYTVYSTRRKRIVVWGMLPIKVEGAGDNKSFTVSLRDKNTGRMVEKRFELYKDRNRRLRVTPPEDMESVSTERRRRRRRR